MGKGGGIWPRRMNMIRWRALTMQTDGYEPENAKGGGYAPEKGC